MDKAWVPAVHLDVEIFKFMVLYSILISKCWAELNKKYWKGKRLENSKPNASKNVQKIDRGGKCNWYTSNKSVIQLEQYYA